MSRSLVALGGSILPPAARLRERYLLDPRVRYLNHASIGTIPRAVHDAHDGYLEVCETNPWLYIWGDGWEAGLAEVRRKGAHLMGASAEDVAITQNTTEGFNLLAAGLPLRSGDEVLFSTLNHPGASVCWHHYAPARGFRVRSFEFPVEDAPGMSERDVVAVHEEEIRDDTRVLVVPHVDNVIGLRHPLGPLSEMARRRGVEYVLVDGAQTAGVIPLDLPATGIDAYATSPHKWIQAPKGLGFVYLTPRLRESVRPLRVTWGQERWKGTIRVFEDYGTRALPAVLALGDALDFQDALGEEEKVDRYREIRRGIRERVEASEGLSWRSPRAWGLGASLVSVGVEGVGANRLAELLRTRDGVVLRPFESYGLNALRVSPNVITEEGELDAFVAAVERIRRRGG